MTHRTRWLVFAISTPLVVLVAVGGLIGAAPAAPVDEQRGFAHLRVFEDVLSLITNAYVEEVAIDPVMDGAMRGLADGLDAESAYLTPAEVEAFDAGKESAPADVGLVVARQIYLRVIGVRDDSPAARAGLHSGDFIRAIDGQPTRDMSTYRGTRLLGGRAGSAVKLVVIRSNPADPHEITLTREAPGNRLAAGRRIDARTVVVRVRSFAAGTAAAVKTELESLTVTADTSVLLDVRNVADGTAGDGAALARLFVKYGPLATSAGRDGRDEVVIAPEPGDGAFAMPLIVLVSNGTAHAAEVFAAAVQGNGRGKLVGEPTPGLAGEQTLVRLPAGHGLWMTHRRYLSASGKPIHGEGLEPDVAVAEPVVEFGEPVPSSDPVLDRALTLARSAGDAR